LLFLTGQQRCVKPQNIVVRSACRYIAHIDYFLDNVRGRDTKEFYDFLQKWLCLRVFLKNVLDEHFNEMGICLHLRLITECNQPNERSEVVVKRLSDITGAPVKVVCNAFDKVLRELHAWKMT